MNKSEKREVEKLNAICRTAPVDMLARSYSALIRAAMTTKSRNEIMVHAAGIPAVVQHPEFIV
jgi:hypothetical protein